MICWAAPLLSHCWNTTTIVKGSVSKWQACELYIIPSTTCTTEKKSLQGKKLVIAWIGTLQALYEY